MDFRVYHYGARGLWDQTRPVYGPTSGLGWPMHYRYPPLFLLLFAPFAGLPLGAAAALWVLVKAGALAVLLRSMWRRLKQPGMRLSGWVPLLLAGPYVVEEFRYGNAQFFVFALTAAALLQMRRRPLLAAASLAGGIIVKVWPLFFVPYLAARGDWKAAGWTLAFTAVLAMLPSLYFGFGENVSLLSQWFEQEFSTQLGESEIWFPNQSLRGVLMRYLTFIDYSKVPDSDYPLVHITTLDPALVRAVWLCIATALYMGLLILADRTRRAEGWVQHSLAFCLICLLQPFTQKYALVILLWPAVVAAMLMEDAPVRKLLYGAIALVLFQPLLPSAAAQRLVQVLGADFAAASLIGAAMALAAIRPVSPRLASPLSKLAPDGLCK
jgi:hypothetical protein